MVKNRRFNRPQFHLQPRWGWSSWNFAEIFGVKN